MKKTKEQKQWEMYCEIVRDRWGNISDQEIQDCDHDQEKLAQLISKRYQSDFNTVKSDLDDIALRLKEGHPLEHDSFMGLEEIKDEYKKGYIVDSDDPSSQEWHAREESNKDNPYIGE
jgi:hypothetical protein